MSHKIVLFKSRLAIRVTIARSTTYCFLPAPVDPAHWSKEANFPLPTHPKYKSLVKYLEVIGADLDEVMHSVYATRMSVEGAKELIKQKILGAVQNNTLQKFAGQLIKDFEDKKQPGNARWYKIAVDQFIKFNRRDIHLSDINYALLLKFRQQKESEGLKPNSINNYIRALRAIYREAQRQEVFETSFKYPFQVGLTPSQTRTMPRNISQDDIHKLERANLSTAQQRAVDFWLIGFYLQGADFIDIANLTRFNLIDGYFCFSRAKTGQPVKVKAIHKIMNLINKYWDGRSLYLLPILSAPITNAKELELYQNKLKQQNKGIARAAKLLSIDSPLTSKWLRHSWITIAKRLYIDEDIRKQAVGHRSTAGSHSVYSDDFQQHVVDAANLFVLGEITRLQYEQAITQASVRGAGNGV